MKTTGSNKRRRIMWAISIFNERRLVEIHSPITTHFTFIWKLEGSDNRVGWQELCLAWCGACIDVCRVRSRGAVPRYHISARAAPKCQLLSSVKLAVREIDDDCHCLVGMLYVKSARLNYKVCLLCRCFAKSHLDGSNHGSSRPGRKAK